MQAVILAGGLGTRLRPLESYLPKPLVNVGGRPFLDRLVTMLARRGLRRFLFLLAHKSDVLIRFLGDARWRELEIGWSVEDAPMGTAGALAIARDKLETEFVLIYGDSYLDFDYAGFVGAFRGHGTDMTMAVYDNAEDTDVPNNVAVDGAGYVTHYSKSGAGTVPLTHVDAGVIAARRSIVERIPGGCRYAIESLYPSLIVAREIKACETGTRFYDIGTPSRLAEFERYVSHDHIADPV